MPSRRLAAAALAALTTLLPVPTPSSAQETTEGAAAGDSAAADGSAEKPGSKPPAEKPAASPSLFQRLRSFGNPSPTAGTDTSQKANEAADQAMYKPVEYVNKETRGPALIVLPGQIKSGNATFAQRILPNNIADFAEVELSAANFSVLERANLGALLDEISLAYNLGDPNKARKTMSIGRLKSTRWVLKFDILKAEPVAENRQSFDGRAIGSILQHFGGTGGLVAGHALGSVKTEDTTGIWLIGMRYVIMDAATTEQVAQGYQELKMEVGAKQTSVLGMAQSAKGGVGLDTMVQRLVQLSVHEIDAKHK